MNNFTPRAQQILQLARKEAERFHRGCVGTEHVLLAIIALNKGIAGNVLQRMNLELEAMRIEVEKAAGLGPESKQGGTVSFTPRMKQVLALAGGEARSLNHTYVGAEHILLALLKEESGGLHDRLFQVFKVDRKLVRRQVMRELDPNYDENEVVAAEMGEVSASVSKVMNDYLSIGTKSDGLVPLRLLVDPGDAPPEVIADILADLSIIYHKQGGTGIEFRLQDMFIDEEAHV